MKIFKQVGNEPPLIDGHIYLIQNNYCYDLTLYYGEGNEPADINDPKLYRLNSAADLLWPDKEIPFRPGDYYDADRRK